MLRVLCIGLLLISGVTYAADTSSGKETLLREQEAKTSLSPRLTDRDTKELMNRYGLFKVVQKIHACASSLVKKYEGLDLTISYEPIKIQNPCWGQTKAGLCLAFGAYPSELCTPWGMVCILKVLCVRDRDVIEAFSLDFLKNNLKISFCGNIADVTFKDRPVILLSFQVVRDEEFFVMHEVEKKIRWEAIERERLQKFVGTDTLIIEGRGAPSIYEIQKFAGQELEKVKVLSKQFEFRPLDLVGREWEYFSRKYAEETSGQSISAKTEKSK